MDSQIITADTLNTLRSFPDSLIQCCVTSPPYYGLRDYGIHGQIGLEDSPEAYVSRIVEIFREVRRTLRDDGTLWMNLGDSYTSNKLGSGGQNRLRPKNLVGIPWRVAFALQSDGWYLRSDIIWAKPNPMPESVSDRPTRSHEYVFLLSKSPQYFYDAKAIREPLKPSSIIRLSQSIDQQIGSARANGGAKTNRAIKAVGGDKQRGHHRSHGGFKKRWDAMTKEEQQANGANRRSVWKIATRPYADAHFATFPPELPELCIRAGSREGDTVLDPFLGSGTTAYVARELGRRYIGIELNPKYVALAEKRMAH